MSPTRTVPPVTIRTYIAAHPARPARRGADPAQRIGPEPGAELRAAGVRQVRDLEHGVPHRQPRAGGQVLLGEIQVQVELVAGEGPARPVGLDGGQHARAHQRELGGRVCGAVRRGAAAAGEPPVADEAVRRVEDGLVEDLALAGARSSDDQLQRGGVAGRGEDVVEVLVQVAGERPGGGLGGRLRGSTFCSMGVVSPIGGPDVGSGHARRACRPAALGLRVPRPPPRRADSAGPGRDEDDDRGPAGRDGARRRGGPGAGGALGPRRLRGAAGRDRRDRRLPRGPPGRRGRPPRHRRGRGLRERRRVPRGARAVLERVPRRPACAPGRPGVRDHGRHAGHRGALPGRDAARRPARAGGGAAGRAGGGPRRWPASSHAPLPATRW